MTSSEIEIFTGARQMSDRVMSVAEAAPAGIKKLRLYGFNFGDTSTRLIEDLSEYLADDFAVEVLAWDTRITRLKSRTDADVLSLLKATNVERIYNVLNSAIDNSDDHSVSDTFAELLLLGSDVLVNNYRHKDLLNATAIKLQSVFSDPQLLRRMGYVRMRIVPNYVPAMCVILDDRIFARLYTSQRHQVGLSAPAGSELYTHLSDHFDEVWSKATDSFGSPMGRGVDQELELRRNRITAFENQTDIFISYRRNDAGWAAAALHDRLSMAFGMERVFLDHRTIRETKDWDEELERALRSARVFLPLFGPEWANEKNLYSLIHNPEDMVRFEFQRALAADPPKSILPVLVERHEWPKDERFPDSVKQVLKKQSHQRLNFETYHTDASNIVGRIKAILAR